MNSIKLYGSIQNGGDGSAYVQWFLTAEEAEYDQENQCEGWGEECIETIETFVDSCTHAEAITNSKYQAGQRT